MSEVKPLCPGCNNIMRISDVKDHKYKKHWWSKTNDQTITVLHLVCDNCYHTESVIKEYFDNRFKITSVTNGSSRSGGEKIA